MRVLTCDEQQGYKVRVCLRKAVTEEIQDTKLCAVTQDCLCPPNMYLLCSSQPPAHWQHELYCRDVTLCSIKHRFNGLLHLSISLVGLALPPKLGLVIYGVLESNAPIFCLSTGGWTEQLQKWCFSPSSSRQPVAAEPPWRCPWCWREQKHQSRSPPPRSSRNREGLKQGRGRHHVYLIQLRSLWGLPWENAAKEGGSKPVWYSRGKPTLCPYWIQLISQLSEWWSSQTVFSAHDCKEQEVCYGSVKWCNITEKKKINEPWFYFQCLVMFFTSEWQTEEEKWHFRGIWLTHFYNFSFAFYVKVWKWMCVLAKVESQQELRGRK